MDTGQKKEDDVLQDDFCLRLSSNMITFQGVSKSLLTNVCFDECNIQVFSILSGQDTTEVTVRSPYCDFCTNFSIEEKGRVMSIKFSPDQEILALQRTPSTIEFFTFKEKKVHKEFSQSFKGVTLLGYMWSSVNDLIVVMNTGIKLFKIDAKSCTVSASKNSLNLSAGWYTYHSLSGLLLVKVLELGKPAQLLQIRKGQISKLTAFDLYSDSDYKGLSNIDRDDVIIGIVYNKPRILFVNYRTTNTMAQAEVIVRTLINANEVKVTNVLRINSGGRFGLNVVDNLIIVHNQNTKSSLIFDITNAPFEGVVTTHKPLVEPMSLKSTSHSQAVQCELYSPNWVIFQPNIIMDVIKGCLWGLELNLNGFYKHFENKNNLIKFLLLRKNSQMIIANILLEIAFDPARLEELAEAFYEINKIYRSYLEWSMKSQLSQPIKDTKEDDFHIELRTILDEEFLNNNVFMKLEREVQKKKEDKKAWKILTWTLIEYIRSLTDFQIPAEHFIYELLIQSLVANDNYYQLHQLLQYHVIADSKPIACRLLSLQNEYPAAAQLAIDMLERLGSGREEITEILLSDAQVLTCLRYTTEKMESNEMQLMHLAEKYMAAAAPNQILQHSIANYFESKLIIINGTGN
ncbi:regulator of MON1-CCZ1 complex [Cimex lectularius]|uniref:Mic1 domain-containing protein n=1 Tax=Cimex lectularius TaxID=79782 RepID=A0A8I6RT26_CIMLE|nr:regulator of MON1-CCZ1 complex [Cimex lectularius]